MNEEGEEEEHRDKLISLEFLTSNDNDNMLSGEVA